MPVLVGIVEDHPAMLFGIVTILNRSGGIRVAASGATANEVARRARRLDVVLLDLALSDGSTPAENILTLESLAASILAYTSGDEPHRLREAVRAGASGMIAKSESLEAITASVRRAAQGHVVATTEWADALDADRRFVAAHLSQRESEVLSLYASGQTAERVAQTLFLSRETVLDHIRRIRAKYAAVDRTAPTKVDLFRRAVEDGLVLQPS
ncbi:response regulator transcription factor [Microbacterium sp. ZOR0019]|uniref:response regulator transcription factor n=1 Tax=Microbacterium sp. ZOR0019 TaxID=1339233 RepID=UPI000645BF5E|nr:response regulator transcription factor [Microbacterium sp. ZOR0019]